MPRKCLEMHVLSRPFHVLSCIYPWTQQICERTCLNKEKKNILCCVYWHHSHESWLLTCCGHGWMVIWFLICSPYIYLIWLAILQNNFIHIEIYKMSTKPLICTWGVGEKRQAILSIVVGYIEEVQRLWNCFEHPNLNLKHARYF